MDRVDQFLQHGLLPFTGRKEEIARIREFFTGTLESQQLRALLLTAEAGGGKSRLNEEIQKRIAEDGSVVLHAKLYPEGANDPVNLIAGAINSSEVLPSTTPPILPDLIGALRRIARLRPTLLIIEDIHLLADEALGDLTALLSGLADEPVSLILLARPVQLRARGVLEPYLIETIEMKGLIPEEIGELWELLFNVPPRPRILSILAEATRGNGLALRSVLRGIIRNGLIARHEEGDGWRLRVPEEQFAGIASQSVSVVVEGLLSHLTPGLRREARRLAMLGEVFAVEAGERIIGSREDLDGLIAGGLIVTAGSPTGPIPGFEREEGDLSITFTYPSSRLPLLAFTHSLLHSHLVEENSPEEDYPLLCHLLDGRIPLYSLLPFKLLRSVPIPDSVSGDELNLALHRTIIAGQLIERTANWREGLNLWWTARNLVDQMPGRIEERIRLQREAMLRTVWLSMWRRETGSPEWVAVLEEGLAMTKDAEDQRMAMTWLFFCSHWFEWQMRIGPPPFDELMERVMPVVERFPEFRGSVAWIYILEAVAIAGKRHLYPDRVVWTLAESEELLARTDLPPQVRSLIIRRLLKHHLLFYTTAEEIEEKKSYFEIIEAESDEEDAYYGVEKAIFLMQTGELERAADLALRVSPSCRERGIWLNFTQCVGVITICRALAGESFDDLLLHVGDVARAQNDPEAEEIILNSIPVSMTLVSFLLGVDHPLQRMRDAYSNRPEEDLSEASLRLLDILDNDHSNTERSVEALCDLPQPRDLEIHGSVWDAICQGATEKKSDPIVATFTDPVLSLADIISSIIAIRIGLLIEGKEPDRDFVEKSCERLSQITAWYAAHNAPGGPGGLRSLYQALGEEDQFEEWSRSTEVKDDVGREVMGRGVLSDQHVIRLSLLGTIRVAIPPDDFVPIRGVRIRTLLGLMVADRMIERPLSPSEFLRIAGDDDDPEHARKKKNMGVVRLREILGKEVILTDGETPRLNLEMIEVDLLKADRLIRASMEMSGRDPRENGELVLEGLKIINGEVPFPTLYDPFFEAVRDDFEERLRRSVIACSRRLAETGEKKMAEEIVNRAYSMLPGDEELADLLQQLLAETGQHVEAERIRMAGTST